MMRSLHARLLSAASLVLAGFLGATGLALDEAFQVSAEASMQDRLQSYIYALLAAADEDGLGRMILPEELPDPRFSKPDSGLYAMVAAHDGRPPWRSPSLTGREGEFVDPQAPGERYFHRLGSRGMKLNVINFGVAWADYAGAEVLYTFAVAEDASAFEAEIGSFRTALWFWLGGMALVLLLAQGFILRWGLRPLRDLAADLQRIERGRAERLDGTYPTELVGLTSNLNSLIEHGKAVQTRYRNSLDDLAHSLKTPLAILQSFSEEDAANPTRVRETLGEQVSRMDELVRRQLQRAAVAGRAALARPVGVSPIVERLVKSLHKVYREKEIQVSLDLDPEGVFYGDAADLMEVLGNLIENAYKYTYTRVHISVRREGHGESRPDLDIVIEDDGGGIDPGQVNMVLQRGKRMDEAVPGHGIGLSVAHEIVLLYGGTLSIGSSDLGGALLHVRFEAKRPATN